VRVHSLRFHPRSRADSRAEGEQFANAYFDTETKIKMLVPRADPGFASPGFC